MLLQEPLLLAACEYPQDIKWHRSPGMQAALQGQLQNMLHCQIVKTRCAMKPLQVVHLLWQVLAPAVPKCAMSAATTGMWSMQTRPAIVPCSLLATIEERIRGTAEGNRGRDGEAVGTWAFKSQPHIPLLQRAKEPSMQERLQKLGKTTLGQ